MKHNTYLAWILIITNLFSVTQPILFVRAQEVISEDPTAPAPLKGGVDVNNIPHPGGASLETSDVLEKDTQFSGGVSADPVIQSDVEDPRVDIAEPTEDVRPVSPGSDSQRPRDIAQDTKRAPRLEANSLTGSLSYEYPLAIPPGRGGLSPNINLIYSSQSSDNVNIYGYGWNDNIPYIERLNKTGSDKLYGERFFTSSFDGELSFVASSTTSEDYGAKVEAGDFRSYKFVDGSYWVVTDKNGLTYTYGLHQNSRQDNAQNSLQVFKWMLEEVRDANGNVVKYSYFKDAGQIYPEKITYTGTDLEAGVFELVFEREARGYPITSYRTGFLVSGNYRVTEIQVKINNIWVKKFDLGYTGCANERKLLLCSLSEMGQSDQGVITQLPATLFEYQTEGQKGWNGGGEFPMADQFITNNWNDNGVRPVDVNGDSLVDLITARLVHVPGSSPGSQRATNINTLSGWSSQPQWNLPTDVVSINTAVVSTDNGMQFADVNGDMRADFIHHPYSDFYTFPGNYTLMNNGDGWTEDSVWRTPSNTYSLIEPGGPDAGVRYVDVNGDGLTDILVARFNPWGSYNEAYAFINNGNGWSESSMWNSPEVFVRGYRNLGVRFGDLNGDGLVDLLFGQQITADEVEDKVYINTGSGWVLDNSWSVPKGFVLYHESKYDHGSRLIDVNSDGLVDLVFAKQGYLYGPATFINTGSGWVNDFQWLTPWSGAPSFTNMDGWDLGMRSIDVNGDGMEDLAYARKNAYNTTFINRSKKVDLLNKITSSEGGVSTITYKASALYATTTGTNANPKLPQNYDTVQKIEVNDGLGNVQTTEYFYEGGKYFYNNPLDRRPAGFWAVTKTDGVGTTEKTFFHQGDTSDTSGGEYVDDAYKIGRPYRTEIRDASGNLYAVTVQKWETELLGSGRGFVKLIQKTDLQYDGDATHKDKAETYVYNTATGNMTQKIQWGEVQAQGDGSFSDIGSDMYTLSVTYATSTVPSVITAFPSSEKIQNQSGQKVAETLHYYDNLNYGFVQKGNETKTAQWKSASLYTLSTRSYNSYGLITSEVDPRGKQTTYSYDSYNIYPATTTNALNQSVQVMYDYSAGKPKKVIDQNGFVFETVFDGLDRVVEEKQPDLTTPSTLVTKTTYVYTDNTMPRSVKRSDYLTGSTAVDTYTYIDGLDRVIQDRKEAEDANMFVVRDVTYNNRGLVATESLPYFSNGSSRTSPSGVGALFTEFVYDTLKRPVNVINVVGNTATVYSDWKTTITDPRDKVKDLYTDAHGNLVRVDEHNATSTYTTLYEYNGLKNLTKITDALGNVRNFTYDGLGRRLTAEDLHALGDVTFGTYSFEYDDMGNMTQRTDPKNQVTEYIYDDINRVISENYTGASGVEVSYAYDSCVGGIGKLCTATTTSVVRNYQYNALGLPASEHNQISTSVYATSYLHDRQGNITKIVYPDNGEVFYTRNNAGLIETILRKEQSDLTYSPVVQDFDYVPTGQISFINFANGVNTTNTYDTDELYRLVNKETVVASSSVALQENAYTYDANGNVEQIVDTSDTATAKTIVFTYDDLNRLLTASTTNATTSPNYKQTYAYNAIGNISSGPLGSYTYAGHVGVNYTNPHAPTAIGFLVGLTYDKNGNLLTDGSFTHTWNYRNELIASRYGSATTTYGYDHEGTRVSLKEDAYARHFPNRYYDTAGPQATSTKHIFADNLLVATVDTSPTQIIWGGGGDPGGENMMGGESEGGFGDGGGNFSLDGMGGGTPPPPVLHYIHTDHLTGSNVITSQTGTVDELVDYYPYGVARFDHKTGGYSGEKRKFAGTEFDGSTGLNYMGARYQNPNRGHFISQDPVFLAVGTQVLKHKIGMELQKYLSDPQGLNSYSYARNNPLKLVDKSGNYFETAFDVVMFSLSLNAFRQEKSFWNGFSVAADGASLFLPIPAVVGAVRHADDAGKFIKNSERAISSGDNIVKFGFEYAKNIGFKMDTRAWSQGKLGDGLGSLVDHYIKHGDQVGVSSVSEYYSKANSIINSVDNKTVFKISNLYGPGTTDYFDRATNSIVGLNSRGAISTFHKVTDQNKLNGIISAIKK